MTTLPLETNQVYLPFIPKRSSSVIVTGHECMGTRHTRVPGRANSSDGPVTAAAKTPRGANIVLHTLCSDALFPFFSQTYVCAHRQEAQAERQLINTAGWNMK